MTRLAWKNRLAIVASLALAFAAISSQATAICRARFTCSPGYSPYCYFTVTQGGNVAKRIRVEAGGGNTIYGLQPGAAYCTSNQGWPDLDNCNYKPVKMDCE